jgi:hypothetical protein
LTGGGRGGGWRSCGADSSAPLSSDILTRELRSPRVPEDPDEPETASASRADVAETVRFRTSRCCCCCSPLSAVEGDESARSSGNAVTSPEALTVCVVRAVVGFGVFIVGNIDVPRTVAFEVLENLARRLLVEFLRSRSDSEGSDGSGGGTASGGRLRW